METWDFRLPWYSIPFADWHTCSAARFPGIIGIFSKTMCQVWLKSVRHCPLGAHVKYTPLGHFLSILFLSVHRSNHTTDFHSQQLKRRGKVQAGAQAESRWWWILFRGTFPYKPKMFGPFGWIQQNWSLIAFEREELDEKLHLLTKTKSGTINQMVMSLPVSNAP